MTYVMAVLGSLTVLWYVRSTGMLQPGAAWLELSDTESSVFGASLGLCLGAATLLSTRWLVGRFGWAQRLHQDLRPYARSQHPVSLALVALASALTEELLFRGLLLPWIGLVPQALLFGLVHQVSGKSRLAWMGWAALMGLLLGALYRLTGSLLGPLLAHGVVNLGNLLYLRSHDPAPRARALGGLLGHRG